MSMQMSEQYIHEAAREISVYADVEVLVVGGGPAGVCAAVAAARAGARTLLVEKSGCLGGMWTSGLVITLAGFNSWLKPYRRCVGGIGAEWIRRAAEMGWAEDNNGWALNSDPEGMKLIADDMCAESGVQVMLHTLFTSPIMQEGRVVGCIVENADGRKALLARVTVDATGNGDVAFRSGVSCGKPEECQPMTLGFRLANMKGPFSNDHSPSYIPVGPKPGWLEEPDLGRYSSLRRDVRIDIQKMRLEADEGRLPSFGGPWFGGCDDNIIWVNATRIAGDATDAAQLTAAEIRGRREARALADYIKEHVAGANEAVLIQTGNQIGIRETRRIVGVDTLCWNDIREEKGPEYGIGYGCWPMDVHRKDSLGMHPLYIPAPFQIPAGALIPSGVSGLVVGGRCVSSDREANGSIRVGGTCCVTGHAAGIIAAVSSALDVSPIDVPVEEVQRTLLSQKAILSLDD